MKNKCFLLVLIIIIYNSIVYANMEIFTKVKTYNNEFEDFSESAWYYDSVKEAYEMNLFNGMSNNTFSPDSSITIAQAIKLSSTIHSIYTQNLYSFNQNENTYWYTPYVKYAIDNKIIANEYNDYNINATRSELVKILSKALPNNELTTINNINKIPDVSSNDDNSENIYKFYNAGILSGNDKQGTFNPNSNIKRCEVATIITRLVKPEKRVKYSIDYDPLSQYDFVDDVIGVNVKDYSYYFSGKGNQTITKSLWFHNEIPCTIWYKFDSNEEFKFKIIDNDNEELFIIDETPYENTGTYFLNIVSTGEPLKIKVESTGNWEIAIIPIHGKVESSFNGKGRYVSGYFIPTSEYYNLSYTNKGNSPIEFWIKERGNVDINTSIFESEQGECNVQKEIQLKKGIAYYFDIRIGGEWSIFLKPIDKVTNNKLESTNNNELSNNYPSIDINTNTITYSGTGNKVITGVTLANMPYYCEYTHNGNHNIIAHLFYGANNAERTSIVNDLRICSGQRYINIHGSTINEGYIEVRADGDWTIKLIPVHGTTTTNISGKGELVSGLFKANQTTYIANYENKGEHNFIVHAIKYNSNRGDWESVANEIGNCKGQRVVKLEKGEFYFFEIQADNNAIWSIDLGVGDTLTNLKSPNIPERNNSSLDKSTSKNYNNNNSSSNQTITSNEADYTYYEASTLGLNIQNVRIFVSSSKDSFNKISTEEKLENKISFAKSSIKSIVPAIDGIANIKQSVNNRKDYTTKDGVSLKGETLEIYDMIVEYSKIDINENNFDTAYKRMAIIHDKLLTKVDNLFAMLNGLKQLKNN